MISYFHDGGRDSRTKKKKTVLEWVIAARRCGTENCWTHIPVLATRSHWNLPKILLTAEIYIFISLYIVVKLYFSYNKENKTYYQCVVIQYDNESESIYDETLLSMKSTTDTDEKKTIGNNKILKKMTKFKCEVTKLSCIISIRNKKNKIIGGLTFYD